MTTRAIKAKAGAEYFFLEETLKHALCGYRASIDTEPYFPI